MKSLGAREPADPQGEKPGTASLLLLIGRFDRRLLLVLVTRRRDGLGRLMRLVTRISDWPVAVALTLPLALGVIPGLQAIGVRMAWTLALAHLAVEILKRVFSRERPELPEGLEWLVGVPDRFSFPSGHATAAMSMGLPLALGLGLPWGLPVLALAVGVGFARVYLGVHYPSDILAGWILSWGVFAGVLLAGL